MADAAPPPPSRWADLVAIFDELDQLVQSTPGQRFSQILAQLHALEVKMGANADALNASLTKLKADVDDVPNRVAAVVANAVAAAVGPLNDQIVAKDAQITDLTAQVATLTASSGDAVTPDEVSQAGAIDGALNTALPPVTSPTT